VSVLVLAFLFCVLVYELHEENWRVNGQICQPFGPVKMDECDEGDIVHGYRSLAWTTASIGFACILSALCMAPFLCKADRVMQNSSRVFGFHPLPLVCPIAALIFGVSFYAFFLTFIIFTVSTGESVWKDTDQVPAGQVRAWEFYDAPRVLVFFDVAMILWWLSFIAHSVEFVTACTTASWYYSPYKKDMLGHVRRSVHAFMRYHLGSVLLASAVVPTGRMLRNLFGVLKFVLRHCCKSCLGCSMVLFKPCLLAYEHWFKFMSSDGLAFMGVLGESFYQSARKGYFVVRRHNSQKLLNSGNMIVWLFQLTVMMSGVVFCVWWLDHEQTTFKDLASYRVTSITAMAIYELFITWFFAQVLGAYIRGVMHGSVMSYLIDNESNSGKMQGSPFAESMRMLSDMYTSQQGGAAVMTSKEAGEEKGAAAPVLAEGLVGPEVLPVKASGSGEAPLQPQTTVVPPTTAVRGKPSAVHS